MIRQYGQERLEASGDTGAVRQRHAEYFIAVSEASGPHLRTRRTARGQHVVRESENFLPRSTGRWKLHPLSTALRAVAPLMVTGMPIGWNATDWAETRRGRARGRGTGDLSDGRGVRGVGSDDAGRPRPRGELAASSAREAELGTAHVGGHRRRVTDFYRGDLDSQRVTHEHGSRPPGKRRPVRRSHTPSSCSHPR